MSNYQNLPVFRESYDFLVIFFQVAKALPRECKYTVGERIKNESLEMILSIHRANASRSGRTERVAEAIDCLERIRILLRILKDTQRIGLERFVELSEKIESVGRQLYGWHRGSMGRPESR